MRVCGWTVAEPILEREGRDARNTAPQQGRESGGPHDKLCRPALTSKMRKADCGHTARRIDWPCRDSCEMLTFQRMARKT